MAAPPGPRGGATVNAVKGNAIGTDASGTLNLGNAYDGVIVYGANNLIGGSDTGAGNRIMYNGVDGVRIGGGTGNTVQANTISYNAATGVTIWISASGNHVWDNEIVHNGGIGVRIGEGAGDVMTVNNDIRRNAISANAVLGISLGGSGVPTPNHTLFTLGPNNYQNYPVLSEAMTDGTSATVTGTLQSPFFNTNFVLEFFVNTVLDPSGFGQGEQFLRAELSPDMSATVNPDGSVTVATDGSGYVPRFTVVLDGTTPDQFLTATATDPLGNTSEFSEGVQITAAGAGPGTAGRIAAWALGQRAAVSSAPPLVLPPPERLVPVSALPPTDSMPFRYDRPDPAAVDDFFSGAWLHSQGALRDHAAAALSEEDTSLLSARV